jgi:hypothetical protein
MIAVPRSAPYFDGRSERKVTDLAEAALRALSDLGAVVLMPAKAGELKEGQHYTDREPGLTFVHPSHWGFDGSPHLPDPEATVYVNALESDQS